MQESRGFKYRPRESGVFLNPVNVQEFFLEEDFVSADSWNSEMLTNSPLRLKNSIKIYSPSSSGIPLPIAQMAVYVYESVRMARNGRDAEHIEIGLDDLTEHGLNTALVFCGRAIGRLRGVDNLGGLTRTVAQQFNNLVFVVE